MGFRLDIRKMNKDKSETMRVSFTWRTKAAVGAEFISLMGLIAFEDLLMCN